MDNNRIANEMTNRAVVQAGEEIGIVLLHGAGLNGSVWEQVISGIAVPCLTAEYPYRDGEQSSRQALCLRDYAAHVIEQIEAWPVRRIVLVAHSLGGTIALQVAEALKDRVVGCVAVGAVIPADGGAFLSALPWPQRSIMRVVIRLLGTKPPESVIRQGLCSDLSAGQADGVVSGFVPEAVRVYTDRVQAGIPDVPRWYVKLELDRELSPALQDKMAANLGAHRIVNLPSGHLPMLSKPLELQQMLRDFMARHAADQSSLLG